MKPFFFSLFFLSSAAVAHDPVIVVKRTYVANVARCLENLRESSCEVRTSLARGALHYDYATSAKIPLAPNRQLTVQAEEYGYQVHWWGPSGTTADEIRQDVFVGLTKHAGEAEVFLQIYREATVAEAELAPGTPIVEEVDYTEVTLGKALGVKRNLAVRAADCAKTFARNVCEVTYLAEDDPDHPGPPFAQIEAELKYAFPDGSSFRATDFESYHGFTLTYRPVDPAETDAAKLEKIHQGLTALKGAAPDAYLQVYAFTPQDPAKLQQPAYASGAVVDETIAPASYATEGTWTLDLAECRKTYQAKNQTCEVQAAGQPATEPAPLFAHALDAEQIDVALDAQSFVRFGATGDGFRITLKTDAPVGAESAWPLLEKAWENLEGKTVRTKRMKVFATRG